MAHSIAALRTTRWIVAGALVLAGACSDGDSADPAKSARHSPPERPAELLYMKGNKLSYADLDTVATGVIATLPSAEVAMSPDATRFAVVGEGSSRVAGDEEGFVAPMLVVAPVEKDHGRPVIMGPGRAPAWSPDGTRIAALDDGAIVVYDADGGADQEPETVLVEGPWSLLGWTEGPRMVAAGNDEVVAAPVPGSTGTTEPLGDLTPSEVWGVSPADLVALVTGAGGTALWTPDGESPVPLQGAQPGDGAWAPDGSTIAVAAIAPAEVTNYVALIDAVTGDVTRVPDSDGAQGNVVWSPDSAWFAYVKVATGEPGKLEAIVCSIELACESELTWKEGVSLLALAGESSDG